ncbi:MAG: hypothetical protein ABSF47_03825 [Minisyncoccia bacterium]|jgi:hypothetical protein
MRNQLTTLVLGEVSKAVRGAIFQSPTMKSGPHYFPSSVPHQVTITEEKAKVDGRDVIFSIQGYQPDILVIETSSAVPDIFDEEKISALEKKIYEQSYKILKRRGGSDVYSENYSIFQVSDYKGDPEQFLTHASSIAALLKSEKLTLDPKEVDYTLSTQIKYAKHDLSIIDWDGAFLFDVEGNFGLAVELLSLANLQLLRHRILDRKLDERLESMLNLVREPESSHRIFRNKALVEEVRSVIKNRITLISAFQSLERDIKLIGDWYSARFYDLATKKFKISEWRSSIKEKMDSIEDIQSTFIENFTISRKDWAEWLILTGWLILIILEFILIAK